MDLYVVIKDKRQGLARLCSHTTVAMRSMGTTSIYVLRYIFRTMPVITLPAHPLDLPKELLENISIPMPRKRTNHPSLPWSSCEGQGRRE